MEVKIGTSIILEPLTSDYDDDDDIKCKVMDKKDNILYVSYPINVQTGKTLHLLTGTEFRAIFQKEDKIYYAFETKVLGRKNDHIPMIMLSCPPAEEFTRIQRREFVRIKTDVDVAVEHNHQFYQFVTENISAGGIAVKLKNPSLFNLGDKVKLTIVLPYINGKILYVQTDAEVVRIYEKNEQRFAAFKYVDIDQTDQQNILRFCFERQVILMKEMKDLQ